MQKIIVGLLRTHLTFWSELMISQVVIFFYKLSLFFCYIKLKPLGLFVNFIFVRVLFGSAIGLGAKLGKGVNLGYGGLGTVIHRRAIVGDNVRIGANVTIGGTSRVYGVPVIGNNVIISNGAVIIGNIVVGEGAVIGANSVVTKNVPSKTLVVGAPAKVIKNSINYRDY